jgi:sugar phosphate isomerase/epimerase
LEAGEVTLDHVLDQAFALGADYVQVELYHVRKLADQEITALADHASGLGLGLTCTGGALGRPYFDGNKDRALDALASWLNLAARLRSPFLVVYSGVYRPSIAGHHARISAQREYFADVLRRASRRAADTGLLLLVENASDFTASELRCCLGESRARRWECFWTW